MVIKQYEIKVQNASMSQESQKLTEQLRAENNSLRVEVKRTKEERLKPFEELKIKNAQI